MMNIEDMNFFNNAGSIPIMFVLIILNFLTWRSLLKIAKLNHHKPVARRIGIKASANGKLMEPLLILARDSYLDLALSSALGMTIIGVSPNFSVFKIFMSTPSNIFCTVITILVFTLCVCLPLRSFLVIHANHDSKTSSSLRDAQIKKKYGFKKQRINLHRHKRCFGTNPLKRPWQQLKKQV